MWTQKSETTDLDLQVTSINKTGVLPYLKNALKETQSIAK